MNRTRGLTLAIGSLVGAGVIFAMTVTSATHSVATAETIAETPAASKSVDVASAAPKPVDPASFDTATVGQVNEPTLTIPNQAPRARASVTSAAREVKAPATTAVPAANGPAGIPTLDASLGFDPASNGLGFNNWGGDTASGHVTTGMLVRMFGARSVCADGVADPCAVLPGVQRVVDAVNQGMTNGRCEGMVAFAGLSFESGKHLGGLSFADAQDDIAYWSLSQVMPRVAERARTTQSKTPSTIVREVSALMQKGKTVTLTIEGDGFAHSVLPVSVRVSGTLAQIAVYDPNYSGQTKAITVDMSAEDWSYADATDESGARVATGGHGAGRLGYVENSLRTGTERVRFES